MTPETSPVNYVLAHAQTGEIEATGTCDVRSFEHMDVAPHQVKVLGAGT
jgi:hypothetical protein